MKRSSILDDCDSLINRIRVPRGKLRNMVRKQRKQVDQKLSSVTEQFDNIFKDIQTISSEFITEIDQGKMDNFQELFERYTNKLREYSKQIPTIQRTIRDFGIY